MNKENINDSIFVCRTPYHILLSSTLSTSTDTNDSYLLVEPWFPPENAQAITTALRSQEIFHKVVNLEPMHSEDGKKNYKNQLKLIEENLGKICQEIPHLSDTNFNGYLYTTGEAKQIDQYLINNLVKGSSGTNIHIEDGTAAYRENYEDNWAKYPWFDKNAYPPSGLYNLKHRVNLFMSYGFFWENITKPEENKWLDSVAAVFPDHVRPPLQKYPAQRLPKPEEWDKSIAKWIRQYTKNLGIDIGMLNIDQLFIAPHSNSITSGSDGRPVFNLIETIAANSEEDLGVKPHPRESFNYDLPDSVSIIPKDIPAEALYILNSDGFDLVIGTDSTALYTAKWIKPSSTVISLSKMMGEQTNLLAEMGVKYPESISELEEFN